MPVVQADRSNAPVNRAHEGRELQPETVDQGQKNLRRGGPVNPEMKSVIEPHIGFSVTAQDALVDFVVNFLELPGILGRKVRQCQGCQLRLKQQSRLKHLLESGRCHVWNLNPAIRFDLQGIFRGKSLKNLTNRHRTDAQFCCETAQGDCLSRNKATREKSGAHGVVHLFARSTAGRAGRGFPALAWA